jgi:hypothetical protein
MQKIWGTLPRSGLVHQEGIGKIGDPDIHSEVVEKPSSH